MKIRFLTALCTFFAAGFSFAEEVPLAFAEFSIARTRWEQKVWGDSIVKNVSKQDVTGLSAVMIAMDTDREVGRSRASNIDLVAPGGEAKISFEMVKCPFFSNYVIEASYFSDGKECKTRFLGRDLFNPPVAERKDAMPGVTYMEVFKAKTERSGKDVKVTITAKNAGEISAANARIRFKFYNSDQMLVREEPCDFNGPFPFGREVQLSTLVKSVPEFDKMRADIMESKSTERILSEGEFSGEEAVEAAGFRFDDRADGAIVVSGRVRNGKRTGVRNVVVKVMLFQGGTQVKEILATPERALAPDETAPFASTLRKPPVFDDYKYETTYEDAEDVVAVGPKDPTPVADPPKEPPDGPLPVDPKPTDPPKDPKPVEVKIRSVAQLIEVSGSRWIDGDWIGEGKQSKYRGSFLVVTLKLTDKNGKTARVANEGMVDFTFKAPAKKDVTGRIKVEKFAWGVDARKFTAANAKPSLLGYDPDAEALTIVLLEFKDPSDWNYTLDLKFTSGEGDVWEWKGLSDPYRAEAMKPNGRKK